MKNSIKSNTLEMGFYFIHIFFSLFTRCRRGLLCVFGQFTYLRLCILSASISVLIASLFHFILKFIYHDKRFRSVNFHIFSLNLAYINQPRLPSIFTNQLLTENLCIFKAYWIRPPFNIHKYQRKYFSNVYIDFFGYMQKSTHTTCYSQFAFLL